MNPSWRYHAVLEPKLVKSEAEDLALGPEWADTPAAWDPESPQFRQLPVAEKKRKPKAKPVEAEE